MRHTITLALLLFLPAIPPVQGQAATPTAPTSQDQVTGNANQPPDSHNVVIKKRTPVLYSQAAEDKKLQGTVALMALFNEAGNFEKADIQSGDPVLAECALASIKKWTIQPFIRNGNIIKVKVPVQFEFLSDISADNPNDTQAAAKPNSARSAIIVLSNKLSRELIKKKIQPEYPQTAKIARIQGTVVLAAVIDEQGVIRELDFVSGHPLLAKSAWDAVRGWNYKPCLYHGTPVPFDTSIRVNYTLSGM